MNRRDFFKNSLLGISSVAIPTISLGNPISTYIEPPEVIDLGDEKIPHFSPSDSIILCDSFATEDGKIVSKEDYTYVLPIEYKIVQVQSKNRRKAKQLFIEKLREQMTLHSDFTLINRMCIMGTHEFNNQVTYTPFLIGVFVEHPKPVTEFNSDFVGGIYDFKKEYRHSKLIKI